MDLNGSLYPTVTLSIPLRTEKSLRYSLQDVDSELARPDIPATQITTARQVSEIYDRKETLINRQRMLRRQITDLELQASKERESSKNQQHKESTGLSKVGIGIDLLSAAPSLIKWVASKF